MAMIVMRRDTSIPHDHNPGTITMNMKEHDIIVAVPRLR
jgi:hypothetical protein